MNVVQLICLILASGLLVYSVVSFVLSLVRKHKAKSNKSITEDISEKGQEP